VKRLSTWDTYVQEAAKKGDRCIELPLTDDEVFVIQYPTRRQGRAAAKAQRTGDVDGLLVALLGKEPGKRVAELAEDQPAYVLDEFIVDVMRKFGMIADDEDDTEDADDTGDEEAGDPVSLNGASGGKSTLPKSTKPSKRSSAVSS